MHHVALGCTTFLVDEAIEKTIQSSQEFTQSTFIKQPVLPVAFVAEPLAIRKTHHDRIRFDQSIFQEGHEPQFPTAKRGIVMCLHAVLHTSFDEVMLVDSDDIFLHDILWANPGYNDTGTLFFYDRLINSNQFFNTRCPNKTKSLHELHEKFPYVMFGLERLKVTKQLSTSQAWLGQTAHEQDSSVVL
ncbi:hypothetical protein THRCLA_07410 [Thraustotheca clavata]|uniref:Uncharacterized protein n=1 Tax=Thraustotheca clavata TaxID=74557 RepID=A0A1V9ZDG0_9STRA|nr:hypothetical protein THRCLA_07410 [Thraustotheca clavata]